MSIIVISDLHLNPEAPEGLSALALLRERYAENCADLYILGDFFEAWIGDDDNNPFIEATLTELQAWKKMGSKLYFMPGNRDFLMGKDFAKRAGWQVLPDPYVIDFYGIKVLLTHGDQLCILDKTYQKWRKYAHTPWLQRLFLALPLWLRHKMALKARQKSKNYVQTIASEKMDIVTSAALTWMKQAGVRILVHGHTHRPGYHVCYQDHQLFTRITLGDWHEGAHALIWGKEGYQLSRIS
ncbi:MAG: UDP-2,3-diacylglucosamine diphosphatase [Gammaproteobacteria bacterium]|nr:UDP-2,3-diacylglucosamine diphosphatase [Gammaproteobacteria bacterium]